MNLGGWCLNSRKIKSHTEANVTQGIRHVILSVKQGHMSKDHLSSSCLQSQGQGHVSLGCPQSQRQF